MSLEDLKSAMRAQMEAAPTTATPEVQEPAPREETAATAGDVYIVRNCSTRQVMETLRNKFGGTPDGRYIRLGQESVGPFEKWAAEEVFFVRKSTIGNVIIMDLMVDNSRREPRFRNDHG